MFVQESQVRLFAPAKINLYLRVARLRADGFHPILSWMSTVQLFDVLDVTPLPYGSAPVLTCDDPSLPTDDRNLVVRVLNRVLGFGSDGLERPSVPDSLRDPIGAEIVCQPPGPQGARVELTKRIPVGGGLGGGSSDAVVALDAILKVNGLSWPLEKRARLLNEFGSDLAFFLHAPSAVCTGRGEVVRPVPMPAVARWAMLMFPDFPMPTSAVYRRFDEMGLGNDVSVEPDWAEWSTLPAVELMSRLVNDLERPAFDLQPELGRLRSQAENDLQRIVRMSGSGSTLFTLFDSQADALLATNKFKLRSVTVELGV